MGMVIGLLVLVAASAAVAVAVAEADVVVAGGRAPESPAVSGGKVAYADRANNNFDIVVYDAGTGTAVRVGSTPADEIQPAIFGSVVVFVRYVNGSANIYAHDLSTGMETPVCVAANDQIHPSIWGTTVVWEDYRNGYNPGIYSLDLATGVETRIESGYGVPKRRPVVAGDLIVWEDYSGQAVGRGDADIRMKSLSTGASSTIAGTADGEMVPATDGRYVVWAKSAAGGMDVMGYDVSTGETFVVRRQAGEQSLPAVGNGIAYWVDNSAGSKLHVDAYSLPLRRMLTFDSRGTGEVSGIAAQGGSTAWLQRNGISRWEVRAAVGASPELGAAAFAMPTPRAWAPKPPRAARVAPKTTAAATRAARVSALAMGTPSNLIARPEGLASVTVTWRAVTGSPAVVGYRVYRSTWITGPPSQVASVTGGSVTSATFAKGATETLPAKYTYYYSVRAVDASGSLSGTSAMVAGDPHGTYKTGYSIISCTRCHAVHGSPTTGALGAKTAAACYECHGATGSTRLYGYGSTYDTQGNFGDDVAIANDGPAYAGRWVHRNSYMATIQRECDSCHTPHRIPATTPVESNLASAYNKLMRVQTATNPVDAYGFYNTYAAPTGNDFCFACHGSGGGSALTAITIVGGDSAYTDSLGDHESSWDPTWNRHADTAFVTSTSPNPGITCTACHDQHGGPADALLGVFDAATGNSFINGRRILADDNVVCFACHSAAITSPAAVSASGYPDRLNVWPGEAVYGIAWNAGTRYGSMHGTGAAVPAYQYPGTSFNKGECRNCHSMHGSANRYDIVRGGTTSTPNFGPAAAGACFDCHDADGPATRNIAQYWGTYAGGTQTTTTATRYGHQTKCATSTVLPKGSAVPCYACHNPHGTANSAYGLLVVTRSNGATYVLGDDANEITMTVASSAAAVRNFCFACHTTCDTRRGWQGNGATTLTAVAAADRVLGISRLDQRVVGGQGPVLSLPFVNGHRQNDTDSCYKCHGNSYGGGANVHNPSGGLSGGGTPCYACHTAYQSPMEDGLGAATGATRASYAHHVLGNATSDGDTVTPNGTGSYPTSTTDVFCLSCHTDHNYFNGSSVASPAANLRVTIANVSGAVATNTDFIAGSGSGGSGVETLTARFYAVTTSDTPSTWDSDANSLGATDTVLSRSTTTSPFDMWQTFGTYPTDWTRVIAATVTVVSRANDDGWGASSGGGPPTNETRYFNPTADADRSGTWTYSAGTVGWSLVDDYPTLNTADRIISPTVNNSYFLFTSVTPTLPSNATNIRVYVVYNARKNTSGSGNTCTMGGRLKVNGSYYTSGTVAVNASAYTDYTVGWVLNPDTGSAWTPDDVNGTGANPMQQFGVQAVNVSAMAARVPEVYRYITYTVPGGITNDDQWTIQYSTNGGASWTNITAANSASEPSLANHVKAVTVGASGLETNTASDFRVRIRGIQQGASWDGSGTVDWDGTRLDVRYLGTAASASGYGICVSCHAASLVKQGMGSDQLNIGAANTPVIDGDGFKASLHSYWTSSTIGLSTFRANCSKCHSDDAAKEFQSGSPAFGTHYDDSAGLLSALGAYSQNPPADQACRKCHDASGDVFGTPMAAEDKAVDATFTSSVSKHPLSKVTCANCHNVHTASGTDLVADADNTYRSAGYSLADGASVNAACLVCHDGTLPARTVNGTTLIPYTVSANATANIGTYYLTGGHGQPSVADCRDCHEQHGSTLPALLNKSIDATNVPANDQRVCFACHDADGPATDIRVYYPAVGYGTAPASNPRTGHRTKTAGNLPAGSALPCDACHNPHGGEGGKMLLFQTQTAAATTVTLGDAAGEVNMTDTDQQTPSNVRNFCLACHITADATGQGWNGSAMADVTGGSVLGIARTGGVLKLPGFRGHYAADTTWSCYLCHGDDFIAPTSVNVHNPASGESRGGIPCYACHTVFQDRMEDSLLTTTGPNNDTSYHHVMGSSAREGDSVTYPTTADAKADVYCLSCHVDHDLFNPSVGAGRYRGTNLRTGIGAAAPAGTSDAAAYDFNDPGGAGSVDTTLYASATSDTANTWANDANSTGAPNATNATSNNPPFDMWQSFSFPGGISTIDAASMTVRSQATGFGSVITALATYTAVPTTDLLVQPATCASTTPFYNDVDDPVGTPDTSTFFDLRTDAGTNNILFSSSATPAVPSNATSISVWVTYRSIDVAFGTNWVDTLIRVGGTTYTPSPQRWNPGNTWVTTATCFPTNPDSGSPWTPTDINDGTSANGLQGFGLQLTDGNPDVRVTQVFLSVQYIVTADDSWAMQFSTDAGGSWTTFDGPHTSNEAALTSHTVDLTGVLTAANAANFRARVLGTQVGTADGAGTVAWDASTVKITYTPSASGATGVCMYCHSVRLAKDNSDQMGESGSNYTPTLTVSAYGASAHDYETTSTFANDNSGFRANCVKCHNDGSGSGGMEDGTKTDGFQSSTYKFGTHYSQAKRLLGALGVATAELAEEERVCYACHSKTSAGFKSVAGEDYYATATVSSHAETVHAEFQQTYRHRLDSYSGVHLPSSSDETRGYISSNKHVECADCHNVHAAQAGTHTAGTNLVSGALEGVTGVATTHTPSTNWVAASTYIETESASAEYMICYKCHSAYNTELDSWDETSGAGAWTDVALEFNPNNGSYHPVVAALPVTDPGGAAWGSNRLQADELTNGWTPGEKMYCSDCHAASGMASFGPHGSGVKWMLAGSRQAWPYTSRAYNGTNRTTDFAYLPNSSTGPDGLFCLNCHTTTNIGDAHTTTDKHGNGSTRGCVMCHIRVPHGSKTSRLIAAVGTAWGNMPARYTPTGDGAASPMASYVRYFRKNAGDPAIGDCNAACYGSHGLAAGSSDATW